MACMQRQRLVESSTLILYCTVVLKRESTRSRYLVLRVVAAPAAGAPSAAHRAFNAESGRKVVRPPAVFM